MNPYEKYLSQEDKLQRAVNQYCDLKKLLYFHPLNEGKKSPFERFKATVLGIKSGVPDCMIIEPRGQYIGLAIELKIEKENGFKKNGDRRKVTRTKPTENQLIWLDKLKDKGWNTQIAWNLDEAIEIIENHLSLKK